MVDGPEEGLRRLDALERDGALAGYHLLPAARADLLRRAGKRNDAAQAYRAAMAMTENEGEKAYLLRRLSELGQ